MIRTGLRSFLLAMVAGLAISAQAADTMGSADVGSITIRVEGMEAGAAIPASQALCTPTADGKSEKVSAPLRPTITLAGVPKTAASLAIFVMDPDVPADFTDAGKDGKTLPADMKRMDFFHYGLVNISPQATRIIGSDGAIDKNPGYPFYIDPADPKHGMTELVNDLGLNNYVDPKSAYGGPCPPWNDERLHRYHFIVLALDKDAPIVGGCKKCMPGVSNTADPNTAKNTFDRLMKSKHVLARGTVVGTYTLNQNLRTVAEHAK